MSMGDQSPELPGHDVTIPPTRASLASAWQAARPGIQAQWRVYGLLLASLPLLLFLLLPLLALIWRTPLPVLLANLRTMGVIQAIRLSLVTTLSTAVLTILFGTPVAYLLARRRFRGRAVLDTLVDLPMVLPPAVAGVALLVAFGRRGLFGAALSELGLEIAFTQTAVVLAQLFVAAPFYVKAAVGGFTAVEREFEEAAAIDGAAPFQIFTYVTLPLVRPVLLGGVVMTWARALGEFGATIIFAGNFPGRTQTMPLAIYLGFELNLSVALTLAIILLVTSFAVLFLVKGILRQAAR